MAAGVPSGSRSISPLNAAIYQVEEAAIAPVEDLALSVEEFKALCEDGSLKPHARNLALRPHLRLWTAPASGGGSRASGHVEIEGFLPNSVLRLAGFKIKSTSGLKADDEKKNALDLFEPAVAPFLQQKFPDCHITVSPATVFHSVR